MILIVEDDEDSRDAYLEFLESLGFRVSGVGTGEDAVAAARTTRFDAVLLDLTLPDVDGRVLCDRLQELAAPRVVPVLALTGHSLDAGERARFTMVMQKPVDLDALAEWLRTIAPPRATAADGG